MRYDCLVTLGSQPDLKTWEFPEQIHECIRTAAELLKQNVSNKVIVSGKWSRRIEDCNLRQPFDECDKLADLLIAEDINKQIIYRERNSTDTISNLYYVKKQFLIPLELKNILFVVADFRIPRLRFLIRKILGVDYKIGFEPIASDEKLSPSYQEAEIISRTKEFLANMDDGDHEWLTDKFYEHPFFKKTTARHLAEMRNN